MANISTYLLAIIAIAFVFQLMSPDVTAAFIFIPIMALSEPWRFVTSMFLHSTAGYAHIFFNAYALFLFGSILERKIREKDYLIIFFGAGLLGGILYYLMALTPFAPLCSAPGGGVWPCPALGASGAIYGLLGAVAVLIPDLRIFVLFFPMKMRHAAILWFLIAFFGTLFSAGSGTAHAGHLGGLIFGLIYGWYLKKKSQQTQWWEQSQEYF